MKDYRSKVEKAICAECVHDFLQHEDCFRCKEDHAARVEQDRVKKLKLKYKGIPLGDVYSQTRRLV